MQVNLTHNPQKETATFVNIKIRNSKIKAMVDSGAEVTVINSKLVKGMGLRISPHSENIKYIAANNKPLGDLGWTLFEIKLIVLVIRQKAIVVEDLSTELLLGSDFLKENGMIINYLNNTLTCGRVQMNLITTVKQEFNYISSVRELQIEPNSTVIEWIKIPSSFGGDVYFEGNGFRNLYTKNGLFKVENSMIPVIFCNKNNFPVRVGKGKQIGYLERTAKISTISEIFNKSKSTKSPSVMSVQKNLNAKQKEMLDFLLKKYEHIFSKGEHDLGFYDKNKFEIDTNGC